MNFIELGNGRWECVVIEAPPNQVSEVVYSLRNPDGTLVEQFRLCAGMRAWSNPGQHEQVLRIESEADMSNLRFYAQGFRLEPYERWIVQGSPYSTRPYNPVYRTWYDADADVTITTLVST